MKKAVRKASEDTQLRLVMRTMRGHYIANVRAGRCKHDPQALAEFDNELEKLNGRAKSLPAQR